MATAFDPYGQWLSIPDGPRPPDHYTLLGLPFGEPDAQAIAQAADLQMARLRRVRPGTQLADWSRLLDQLNAVKVCLTNPTSKAAYDTSARETNRPQPAAAATTASQPALALPPNLANGHGPEEERPRVPFPVGYSQAPTMAVAGSTWSAPPGVTEPTWVEPLPDTAVAGSVPRTSTSGWSGSPAPHRPVNEPQMPWTGLRQTTTSPQQQQVAPMPQPVPLPQQPSAAVAAAAAPIPVGTATQAVDQPLGANAAQAALMPTYAAAPRSTDSQWTAWFLTIVLLGAVGALGYVLYHRLNPSDESIASNEGEKQVEPPAAGAQSNGATQVAAAPQIAPGSQPPTNPLVKPPAERTPLNPPVGQTPPKEAQPPVAPPTGPTKPQEDLAKRAAFKKALSEARFAMSEREHATIKTELQKARTNAQTVDDFNELERLDQIEAHLEGFWKSIRGAMPKLEGELAIGDTFISVVEANEKRILVKAAGQMRQYDVGTIDMPAKLITAIAEKRFKLDAGWKVLYGTFHAMDRFGDRDKARRLWQEAGKTGSAEALLPELNVPRESATKAPGGGTSHTGAMGDGKGTDFSKEIADFSERAKEARSPAQQSEVARDALVQCQKACELKKWDDAAKLAEIAHTAAKAAKNVAMLRQAQMAVQQIEAVRKQK